MRFLDAHARRPLVHIVSWSWFSDVTADLCEALLERTRQMPEEVPGIASGRVTEPVVLRGAAVRPGTPDIVVIGRFENIDAHSEYQVHP